MHMEEWAEQGEKRRYVSKEHGVGEIITGCGLLGSV